MIKTRKNLPAIDLSLSNRSVVILEETVNKKNKIVKLTVFFFSHIINVNILVIVILSHVEAFSLHLCIHL